MKNIFKVLTIAIFATFVLASCETYKLPDTEYTGVSWLDGKYVCFATSDAGKAVFELEITNTTNNDPDKAWVTVTSLDLNECWESLYYGALSVGYPDANAQAAANNYAALCYYMAAYRFPVTCDGANMTFSCSNVRGEEPYTCYNSVWQYGAYGISPSPQAYYSGSGYFDGYREFTVSVSNGKVTPNVPTASGKTTDGISFDLSVKDNINTEFVKNYKIEGIRKTGWGEDYQEYIECFEAQYE